MRLSVDAMEAAWQDLMRAQKKADKQAVSGHKSAAMLDLYDHEVAVVQPAESGE